MGITFKEIGDDCSICPLRNAGRCEGLVNYGNGPVYPPCSEMDENTDVDKYLEKLREYDRRTEEKRKARQKAREEESRKKELQKKRREFSDRYCHAEIEKVNMLKKTVAELENAVSRADITLSIAELSDMVGMSENSVKDAKSRLRQLNEKLATAKTALDNAKNDLLMKRTKVQKTEEYKNIQ